MSVLTFEDIMFDKPVTKSHSRDSALDEALAENAQLRRKIQRLEKQLSDDGWRTNPDRMGGMFSDYETKDTGWK